jgi:hypothetical protein
MVELTGLTDQQLADRYAQCDLRVRQMTQHSLLMDNARRAYVANPGRTGSEKEGGPRMSSEAVKREAERGRKLFQDYARILEAERQRDQMMFPSLDPTSRKYLSPLGGEAAFPWGRKKEG